MLLNRFAGRLVVAFLLTLSATAALAGTALPGFTDVSVGSGLAQPIAIAFLPDQTMLIAEKAGALKRGDGASGVTLTTIPVCANGELGLLGIAIDPSFASNGFVYLFRTRPGVPGTCDPSMRDNEVVRIELAGSPPQFVEGSLTVLFTGIPTNTSGHNGGVLRIGPDGKIYAGVGDAAVGHNVGCPGTSTNPFAQDLGALQGKVLRLNLDGTVPGDNPFVGVPGAHEEIFARGFRNPFRMSFDPISGGLWLGDVGDLAADEINIITAGGNYGWPHCEATLPLGCANPGDVPPTYAYRHDGSCPNERTLPPSLGSSIIGGGFAGPLFTTRDGDYFFGDYVSDAIYHAVVDGSRTGIVGNPKKFVSATGGPVDIVFGPDGALYYVALNIGQVRRVTPPSVAPPTDVDHYACYKARLVAGEARLPLGTSVELQETLDPAPQTFEVKSEVSICNPASRDGSTVLAPSAHEQGFQIKALKAAPRFVQSSHVTIDAFDNRILTVTAADSLLVPSHAVPGAGGAPPYAGSSVDHYQCYKARIAKGQPRFTAPPSPVVTDAFFPGGQLLDVKKITKLCNPVGADGAVIQNAAAHLVCYQVKLPTGLRFTKQTVSTHSTDFGADVLSVTGPSELCLPAATDP